MGTAARTAAVQAGKGTPPQRAQSARRGPRLFDGEPLHFDAAVLVGVGAGRFFPAAADDVEALAVDVVFLDQQPLDFSGPLAAQLDRAERLLTHVAFAAALAEFFDERVVDVAAQQYRRARADLYELL